MKYPWPIPPHNPYRNEKIVSCVYLHQGCCYYCCESCNLELHICHFCGTNLDHNSYEAGGTIRHFLIDCRPDLIDEGVYANSPMT